MPASRGPLARLLRRLAPVAVLLAVGLALATAVHLHDRRSQPTGAGGLDTLSAWQLLQRVRPERIETVSDAPDGGGLAIRFEVRHGDHYDSPATSRAELGYTARLACAGDVVRYAWRTLLERGFPAGADWQDIAQWKNEGTGTPPLQIAVDDGEFALVAGPQLGYRRVWSTPVLRGRWVSFQVAIRFSAAAGGGWVTLAFDGRRVLDRSPMATLYRDRCSYFKLGIYRDGPIIPPSVLYDQAVSISPSAR